MKRSTPNVQRRVRDLREGEDESGIQENRNGAAGRERHRWGNRQVDMGGSTLSQSREASEFQSRSRRPTPKAFASKRSTPINREQALNAEYKMSNARCLISDFRCLRVERVVPNESARARVIGLGTSRSTLRYPNGREEKFTTATKSVFERGRFC